MQEIIIFISGLITGVVAAIYLIAILSVNKKEEEKLNAYLKGYDDGYRMRDVESD